MTSTNTRRVSAGALATLVMIAGLTGSAYGQTPTVSIETVYSKAAPGIADATWKVIVSSTQTTALEIDLDFTYSPGIGTNYLGTSGSITIPANSTSASKDFPLDAYTGTVNGTVTATVATATGYTAAASPDNAASISVSAASQLVQTDLGADLTLTEGESKAFTITWTTVNGSPAPRRSLTFDVKLNTGTALGEDFPPYPGQITGITSVAQEAELTIVPAEWAPSGGTHRVQKTLTIHTADDAETEITERGTIEVGAKSPTTDRAIPTCSDTAHEPDRIRGPRRGCLLFINIEDNDGEVRAVVELLHEADYSRVATLTEATTVRQATLKLDRSAPTGGIEISVNVKEDSGSGFDAGLVPSGDRGERTVRFAAGETEKAVEYRLNQTPGVLDMQSRVTVNVTILGGTDYAIRPGERQLPNPDGSVSYKWHAKRFQDTEWVLEKVATWVGDRSLTVDEDDGTVTLRAGLTVPFDWEATRTLTFGTAGSQTTTEEKDYKKVVKTVTWPARTSEVEFEIELIDDEIAEDDEVFTVIFEEPAEEYWGSRATGDDTRNTAEIRVRDNDQVKVKITNSVNDERPRENFTEGDSFELYAEIVPPCEVYRSGLGGRPLFALDVPIELATGTATLPADTPTTNKFSFDSCTDKVTLTYETVDDSDDEYYRDLWIAFRAKTPTPRSQIYDGDGDVGRFELAEGSKATGFKVRDNDGGGRDLVAVPDYGRDTEPVSDSTHLEPIIIRPGADRFVVWDPIVNDGFVDGDKNLITIKSVTQPEPAGVGTVAITAGSGNKTLTFTLDDDFNGDELISFNYTIQAPRWVDGPVGSAGMLEETGLIASHVRACDMIRDRPKSSCTAPATEATPPEITGVDILDETDGAWTEGDEIKVELVWDEDVTVTGTPTVTLAGSRPASYQSGSGTATLIFAYTVTSADGSLNNTVLVANSLALAGGTIQDADGTDAVLDHEGFAKTLAQTPVTPRSTTPAQTTGTSIDAESDQVWTSGDTVTARITWDQRVTVTGTPTVGLLVAGNARTASFAGGNGSSTLQFHYTVASGDGNVYAVSLTGNSLTLGNDDSIRTGTTDADTSHASAEHVYTEPPATTPLTVSWTAPSHHAGDAFAFDVDFSEDLPGYSYKTMRDQTLHAGGGTVKEAKRRNPPSNQRWRITVEPSSTTGDVSLSLSAPSGCGSANAVCASGDRALSNSLSQTVSGPVGISVADASIDEADTNLDFTVTLSKSATNAVSVNYATQSDSATSGSDFTSTSGTLQFAASDTSKTVSVPILDDDHNEGSEAFLLVLSSASGAVLTDSSATGVIRNRDPLPSALIARFGRATAVHVVDQIQERVEADRSPGTQASFGGLAMDGRRVDGGRAMQLAARLLGAETSVTPTGNQNHIGAAGLIPAGSVMGRGAEPLETDRRLDGLLGTSEMTMNRTTRDGGTLSFWSRGSESTFSGREGTLGLTGDVRSALFGADYARGRWIVGMSAGRSWGNGTYNGKTTGRTHSSVNGVYPWIGYKATDRLSLWGMTGYGRGALLLTPETGTALESTLRMRMTAGGAQVQVRNDGGNGIGLTLKTDALQTTTSVDEVDGPAGRLAATRADISRVRAAIEGSRRYSVGRSIGLRSSVELGVRRDGGDAEQGAGLDLGVGLAMDEAHSGLQVELRIRRLIVHQADGFAEQGVSVSINYDPRPQTPLGLTAEITPRWGGETTSGAEALWGRETMGGIGAHQTAGGNRLDSRIGYGLPLGSRLVGTPQFGVLNGQHGRSYRVGYAIRPRNADKLQIEIGIDAERRDRGGLGPAANSIRTGANVSW